MKVLHWIKQHKLVVIFLVIAVIGIAIGRAYGVGLLLGFVGIPVYIWQYLKKRKEIRRKEHLGECPTCHKCFVFFDDSIPQHDGAKQTIKRVCKECSTKTVEGNKI